MTDLKATIAKACEHSGIVDYELRHLTTGNYSVQYPEINDALVSLHDLLAALYSQASCARCGGDGYLNRSPGGSWWSHSIHPQDSHDFQPIVLVDLPTYS